MARSKPTVAVVGGSLAGLITARLLSLRGWDVHVFERVAGNLSGRGAGIGTHPELFDVLRAAELPVRPDIGIHVELRRLLDRDGRISHQRRYPQVLTHWDRLYSLLRSALADEAYHPGKRLVDLAQDGERVTVGFEDGSSFGADLLVAADGIRSAVRGVLFPDVAPRYVGYVAWRGTVPEERFSDATHAAIFEHFCFCLPPGEQVAGYPIRPVGEAGPGREYNVIWYRPADEDQLDAILTDAAGRRHDMNIPPPLIAPHHTRKVKEDAEAVLAPQFAEAVRLADSLFCQPIYDVEVPRMVEGRVALVGDAAFVARPHVGAGVTKGFSDAMALCRAIDRGGSIPQALRAYEGERLPIGRRILERARHLGAYMQASKRTQAERDAAELHRSPEAVLHETASLDFLSEDAAAETRIRSADMTDLYRDVDFSQCPWPERIEEDLRKQAGNVCVGQVLAAEDGRVRVWHLRLPPGERIPFHTHVLDYFWTCVSGGKSRSRALVNGRFEIHESDLKPGSTRFEHYPPGTYKTHDLENIGDIDLVFVTVEFLDSGSGPWDVPASVRMVPHDGSLAGAH